MGRGGFMTRWRMGRRSLGALALLFGLIAGYGPQPAEAQVTFTQITSSTGDGNSYPSISADGTRIAFSSNLDLVPGGNPNGNYAIFLWTEGSGITQITNTIGTDYRISINANGTRIAFTSDRDLTGGNPDGNMEIFLWTEGSGITQITNTIGYINDGPSISADGTRIAFTSNGDLAGGNFDHSWEIFLWTSGSGITQITNTTLGSVYPSISADGTRIAFDSPDDLAGGNPDGSDEIFLWTSGAGITQITNTTGRPDQLYPYLSADGTRIAILSPHDLTGANPDGNYEIFLWTSGAGITQITNTTGYGVSNPSISADGTRIAFDSITYLTGSNPYGMEIFLWTQSSGITQITNSADRWSSSPSINADGTRITFRSVSNLTGGNPDGNWEIFLATLSPTFPVLSAPLNEATGVSITPTFVWSAVTGANRYWLMVATNPSDLPTDPNATTCPNCVISGSTDFTTHELPYAFSFGRSGTLSTNTTYYWKVQAWNTNGTLANYSTTFRFTTGQPEATDPDRLSDTVLTPPDPTPDRKAVVITHGWNSSASDWVKKMATAFCKKLNNGSLPLVESVVNMNDPTKMCRQINGWDVWVYDWQTDAEASPLLVQSSDVLGIRFPKEILPLAERHGDKLAKRLKEENYRHIHFVAHSAGSKLIETATLGVKLWVGLEGRPTLKIHETFLDAYDPKKELSSYGGWADWADNYVDTRSVTPLGLGDATKIFLDEAYSINVTPGENSCGYVCRHSRPYRFYGYSIDPHFVIDFPDYQDSDPIISTAGMGYPLSVEADRSLDDSDLSRLFPKGERCSVNGTSCYPVGSSLGTSRSLSAATELDNRGVLSSIQASSSTLDYLPAAITDAVIDSMTTAVEYVRGTGASLYSSLKLGWALVTGGAPQQTRAVGQSATSGATTEAPSYLVVNVTTTTPVNTLRFNWSFDTAGEGLLRVFVGGNLVREIDQRHVTPSSLVTEEVYIGGEGVPLPAGTHRITFRLDGFGASASGVELTDVELGMLTVGSTLTVNKAGTGTGTVTSDPSGIDCGATCAASFAGGSTVTLTATPATGSTFAGWSGDCTSSGQVTLDADKTCTATFTRPLPDLTGTWGSLSQSCRTKLGVQTCTLRGQVTVSNQGNAPASAASVLNVFLSSDGTTQETLLAQVAVDTLAVGRTRRARLRVPLPAGSTATGKYVIAVIDATNTVTETDESNNTIVFGPIP